MNGLLFLIPVALMMGLLGLWFFFWTMRNGQYDDMEGAARRIFTEEEDGEN